jgi:hypothetical protein
MEQRLFSWLTQEEVETWDNFYDAFYVEQVTSRIFYESFIQLLQSDAGKWQGWVMDFICTYLIHGHNYGPLSTIFEDLKFSDASIAYCKGLADGRQDSKAAVILTILLNMNMQQRELLLKCFPFGKDDAAQTAGWRSYFQEWKRDRQIVALPGGIQQSRRSRDPQ